MCSVPGDGSVSGCGALKRRRRGWPLLIDATTPVAIHVAKKRLSGRGSREKEAACLALLYSPF